MTYQPSLGETCCQPLTSSPTPTACTCRFSSMECSASSGPFLFLACNIWCWGSWIHVLGLVHILGLIQVLGGRHLLFFILLFVALPSSGGLGWVQRGLDVIDAYKPFSSKIIFLPCKDMSSVIFLYSREVLVLLNSTPELETSQQVKHLRYVLTARGRPY